MGDKFYVDLHWLSHMAAPTFQNGRSNKQHQTTVLWQPAPSIFGPPCHVTTEKWA